MKKSALKRLLIRAALLVIGIMIIYVLGLLAYGTINDFQPEPRIALDPFQDAPGDRLPDSMSLSFTIWNLGFTGLGRESDFFYDDGYFFFSGGRKTRTERPLVEKNLAGILQVVDTLKTDFFLFQEVDQSSRRSYYLDQVQALAERLPAYSGVYAQNFNVPHVPIPIFEPWHAYGQANSGLVSFSRWQPRESVRVQLPGDFSWPTRVFSLDRCLNVQRFAVEGDRELVVVNLHNSAYDEDGALKAQQMNFLRELLVAEYEKGNYVIAGGDWNMVPPYFRFDGFMPGRSQGYTQINISDTLFPPDWLWLYDATYPTNRKARTPYAAGISFVTLIDFYLVSPNVRVQEVRTIHTDFEYSDHQPVTMTVQLQ